MMMMHGHHSAGHHSPLPQQRLVAERKWRLGIQFRGHPSALMTELYRVLQARDTFWRVYSSPMGHRVDVFDLRNAVIDRNLV